jgi:four helix bundle protein
MTIRDFRDLEVWQQAVELAADVYQLTQSYPPEERFGLTSQLRRAAVSVSSNIAEGNGRSTRKDYAHFLVTSRSSLNEVRSLLFVSRRLGFAKPIDAKLVYARAERVGPILIALRASLLNKKNKRAQSR